MTTAIRIWTACVALAMTGCQRPHEYKPVAPQQSREIRVVLVGTTWDTVNIRTRLDESSRLWAAHGMTVVYRHYEFIDPPRPEWRIIDEAPKLHMMRSWAGETPTLFLVDRIEIDGRVYGGMAYLGRAHAWIAPNSYISVAAHELGHCLNLAHSTADCGARNLMVPTGGIGPVCLTDEQVQAALATAAKPAVARGRDELVLCGGE